MRKFGIRMEGCEAGIEEILRRRWQESVDPAHPYNGPAFRYVEIGVAGGETLRSVTEILRECAATAALEQRAKERQWATVGIDLPDGYALNRGQVEALLPGLAVWENRPPGGEAGRNGFELKCGRPHLWLKDAKRLMAEDWAEWWWIDVALVDGCHGKACVKADFWAVERFVAPGGYVLFHDAGVEDQGGDYQPHCREGIRVRDALHDLGLLQDLRAGWRFVREIAGDKSRGGNSCVVVQKGSPHGPLTPEGRNAEREVS